MPGGTKRECLSLCSRDASCVAVSSCAVSGGASHDVSCVLATETPGPTDLETDENCQLHEKAAGGNGLR